MDDKGKYPGSLVFLSRVPERERHPWPLRVVWWRRFDPHGASFELYRQLDKLSEMQEWERRDPHGFAHLSTYGRYYFPLTEKRWRWIVNAIEQRRQTMDARAKESRRG